ncbi:conserved exported hypothetical protein [Xenorhabdus nematophila F1]|uniref:Uncharacterized protein n=1 Tax=Xenorhabdus nematophila (strain ATCC 19061 / DSM 3370 / CCUG 14189 / LMG 1036 / NCIMB 9965 / AN6) TaxID=406817 RepID=D3V8Y5_XENNA|nr:hypothetical protein [Xenorhabdus nematophila]CEE94081.1 hypothetical protein; putative exported protein [Xenorhabdus nematophila str. Anatoliense]CBJ89183.1 hypothetical protein; putative exported protein [Xenorhabdus nematophila ATCC 19061]CCW31205.1 conserved exported hypothetical protein [Xenorhabdus nematophila F1]CEE94662.1 hypothetical protein; putative exported protein [Xenorhabdus nematophila str. Anatoliense]CEK22089.1 hypothetical protein; putative exported protein [Xenorhabdus n
MFKKLLLGGTLAAGIALTGGIATASANTDSNYCYSSGRTTLG